MIASLVLAAAAAAPVQASESRPAVPILPAESRRAVPLVRVAVDVTPPVWTDGDPLRMRVTVENPGPAPLKVPAAWLRGEGIYLRQVAPGRGAPASGAVKELTAILASSEGAAAEAAAGPSDLTLPAASSLAFPLTFTVVKPPAGDAFDVFFLSPAPAAGSASIRVERCENLRGARAHLDTDRGRITFALAPESAPLAVRNFVRLAEAGFYDGVAFHRIVKGLCVQAGDPASKTGDVSTLPGTGGNTFNGQPLPLERSPALFEKGTVGLTRVPDHLYQNVRSALAQYYQVSTDEALDEKLRAEWPSAHQLQEGVKSLTSGTSQFFICTSSIPLFTGRYAAFAKVVAGMEVVEALESSEVLGAKASNPVLAERPVLPPRLFKITIERPSSAAVKTK